MRLDKTTTDGCQSWTMDASLLHRYPFIHGYEYSTQRRYRKVEDGVFITALSTVRGNSEEPSFPLLLIERLLISD